MQGVQHNSVNPGIGRAASTCLLTIHKRPAAAVLIGDVDAHGARRSTKNNARPLQPQPATPS